MKHAARFLSASVIAVCALANGVTAFANGGPSYEFKKKDGDADFVIPVKHSDVEIISERLSYKLGDYINKSFGGEVFAEVSAEYEMRNAGEESVSVLVAFVANNSVRPPEILFDGASVDIIRTESMDWENHGGFPRERQSMSPRFSDYEGEWADFETWEPAFNEIMFYFETDEILDAVHFNPYQNFRLDVTLFELNFEPGEIHLLNVSYIEKAAFLYDVYERYGIQNPRWEFFYLLQPAQYWKDFKDLTVTIEAPRDLNLKLTLDGFVYDAANKTYTAHYDALPDKNLGILVYQKDTVFLGYHNSPYDAFERPKNAPAHKEDDRYVNPGNMPANDVVRAGESIAVRMIQAAIILFIAVPIIIIIILFLNKGKTKRGHGKTSGTKE
jgi:hypothetical protein